MSKPTVRDQKSLKRLARYLAGKVSVVHKFDWQNELDTVRVWSDTNFAGCPVTRKSTSGGIVQLGNHAVKTYSNTQQVIALSSREAEHYGMVRGPLTP